MDNKKIYILTNFSTYLKSYSPIIVVSAQINMFQRAGYAPVLITSEGWNPPEGSIFSGVRTERLPQVPIDGSEVDEAFEADVDKLYEHLSKIIEPNSVVITHDLIFLPDYVKHNVAARRIAERDATISWIHWIHSATSPETLIKERAMFAGQYAEHLAEKFPNSIVAYPNAYDIPRVAKNYSCEENEIVEVPHASDPIEGMSYFVKRLYNELALGDPDVLMVYPIRLDRGKYVEGCIQIMAGCADNDMSSHLLICDFQSTGGDKVVYREELKRLAVTLGIADRVTFLSEFDESASLEVSHETILELFSLSNVFALPSKSETYSLIAQEAMMKGNLCLLNHDFAPFRQIYGRAALYKQFEGANIAFNGMNGSINTVLENAPAYYREIAANIRYYLDNEHVLRAKTWVRTQRNPDYVFRHFIEPLLAKGDNAEILGNSSSL